MCVLMSRNFPPVDPGARFALLLPLCSVDVDHHRLQRPGKADLAKHVFPLFKRPEGTPPWNEPKKGGNPVSRLSKNEPWQHQQQQHTNDNQEWPSGEEQTAAAAAAAVASSVVSSRRKWQFVVGFDTDSVNSD